MTLPDSHPRHSHRAPAAPTPSHGQWGQQPGPWPQQPGPWGQAQAGGPFPGGQVPAPQPPPRKAKKWPWVVGVLAVLVVAGSMGGNDETAPTTPASSAASAAAGEPAAGSGSSDQQYGATTATFGQQVEAGDMTVSAQKPQKRTQEFIGAQFCSTVTYRNTGSAPETYNPFDWKFRTANGEEVSASIPFNAGKALNSGSLRPGGTTNGQVCADTETTGVTEVVYSPGFGIMHQVTFGP